MQPSPSSLRRTSSPLPFQRLVLPARGAAVAPPSMTGSAEVAGRVRSLAPRKRNRGRAVLSCRVEWRPERVGHRDGRPRRRPQAEKGGEDEMKRGSSEGIGGRCHNAITCGRDLRMGVESLMLEDQRFGWGFTSDIFTLIPPLFKPYIPKIYERITSILPQMTNECKKLQNPFVKCVSTGNGLNMDEIK